MSDKKIISKITSGVLLGTMLVYQAPVLAFTKDETVYSKLDASGNAYNTIVSDHIRNTEKEKIINDITDLLNLKNNGEQEYTADGNNLVWKADESDIYYQGESQKELPIECSIKYELNGKEVSAKEIAGKSGKVKITIEYTNKDKHVVKINGKNETLYTPFVVVCGTIVNNENNKNIEIINGKMIDNGNKTTLIGITLPGMQESLGISKEKLEISNKVEITMEASKFEMENIVTYVTPKIVESSDLDMLNDIDEIYSKVNELQSSSKQIEDGANKLKDGSSQLVDGVKELKDGTSAAYSGSKMIESAVESSTKSLQSDKSAAVDSKTLAAIKNQAESSATLSEEQKAAIKAQAEAGATLTKEQEAAIKAQAEAGAALTEAQKTAIKEQAEANAVLTKEQKAAIKAQAESEAVLTETQKTAIKKQATFTETQKTAIITSAQSKYPATLTEAEKQLIISVAQETAYTSAIEAAQSSAKQAAGQTAVQTAEKIAKQVAGQTAVQVAISTAKQAAGTTAVQVAGQTAKQAAGTTAVQVAGTTAKQVAGQTATTTATQVGNQAKQKFTNQVVSQMTTLGESLGELTDGLSTLDNGVEKLSVGTNQLDSGITELAEGITKFNTEGIDKICNYINGDLKDITTRIDKLEELANNYNNFTMLNNGDKGNVKFIMISDGIKSEEDSKEKMIVENKVEGTKEENSENKD